jgi:hypothetical protein
MSPTRKANQRKRMRAVDSVIDAIRQSGVQCKALVRPVRPSAKGWFAVSHVSSRLVSSRLFDTGPRSTAANRIRNAAKRQVHDVQSDIGGVQEISA